jgi:hypothetical protein
VAVTGVRKGTVVKRRARKVAVGEWCAGDEESTLWMMCVVVGEEVLVGSKLLSGANESATRGEGSELGPVRQDGPRAGAWPLPSSVVFYRYFTSQYLLHVMLLF